MAPRTRTYLVLTVVAAAAALAGLAWRSPAAPPAALWLAPILVGVGALAAHFSIEIGPKEKIAPDEAAYFVLFLMFPGASGVALIGAGRLLGEAVLMLRRHPVTGLRLRGPAGVAFNSAQSIVCYTVAGGVFALAGGFGQPAAALVLAALSVYVMETLLTGLMVALQRRQRPLEIWLSRPRRDLVHFGALVLIGAAVSATVLERPWILVAMALPAALVQVSLGRSVALAEQTIAAVEALADVVDRRDRYTYEHSSRVAEWSARLARELRLPVAEIQAIRLAARVHDVGKVGIPDSVLLKAGPLSPDEFEVMKTHAQLGYDILSQFPQYRHGKELVLGHHERFDGQGYPRGLPGDRLPIGAQIICVADCLDAMTSDRPYRKGMTLERALLEFVRGCGTQWNPRVVSALEEIAGRDLTPAGGTEAEALPAPA